MGEKDCRIIKFLSNGPRPLAGLRGEMPVGTLYRHINRLLREGYITRRGSQYQATERGLALLEEVGGEEDWGGLVGLYPPLREVPTGHHRAMIELILAAVVARRYEGREDHHPTFVLMGRTLAWKTSLAKFACYMLGLDPNLNILDCSTEVGKSMWIRRGPTGEVTFERKILDSPFVAFDEYLLADPRVRVIIGHFIQGRKVVPFENEALAIEPVPLITLNPKRGKTLEERTSFNSPQIRRSVICDLDAVTLPDLALVGERPLEVARSHPPIKIRGPQVDLMPRREEVIKLLRGVIRPEWEWLVDFEMITLLCTGMTAFLDTDRAMRQVAYDYCLIASTLGWVVEGWRHKVASFSKGHSEGRGEASKGAVISLWPERRNAQRYDARF